MEQTLGFSFGIQLVRNAFKLYTQRPIEVKKYVKLDADIVVIVVDATTGN